MLKQSKLFAVTALLSGVLLNSTLTAYIATAATTTTNYLNGKIVFSTDRDGNYEIYTMNADGSNQTRLTNNLDRDRDAAWSPDGSKIAYRSNAGGDHEIFVMNADGSGQTQITNNTAYDSSPTWSPDGSKIVFASDRDGDEEVFSMNADGSNQTQLTTNTILEERPTWSPDGSKVMFASNRNGGQNYEIFLMDANGSNEVQVSTDANTHEFYPTWSPDGSKILFTSFTLPSGPYNVYSMKLDGSDKTLLHTFTATSFVNSEYPTFSPDGKKLLLTVYDGAYSTSNMYTMNLSDESFQQLTGTSSPLFNEAYSSQAWQKLPYSQSSEVNGKLTSLISVAQQYPTADYTVSNNETLVLDGALCDVTVASGAVLMGDGTVCTLTVQNGGTVSPGHSPGCISSGNTTLSGSYSIELGGTTPCSQHDQLKVSGSITAGGNLTLLADGNYTPTAGDSYMIIENDGTDAVTNTFNGLSEGSTLTSIGYVFSISYLGGTGNDVVLTAIAPAPAVPNTGFAALTTSKPLMYLGLISAICLALIMLNKISARLQY